MIDTPLTLPCGVTLSNRLVKTATSDGLGDGAGGSTEAQARLYRRWAEGGAGLILIGEAQVDFRYPERPGNIALDEYAKCDTLRRLTAAGTTGGNQFWAQISHAGALTFADSGRAPLGPSAVRLPGADRDTDVRAMTADDIAAAVAAFATAARRACDAGFTGLEVHGAHGFLISQFLSPVFNQRTDAWGGSLENRARFLFDVLHAVRAAVGPGTPVALKLNSTDFQKGGFTREESRQVAAWLDAAPIDLLEISGGTYASEETAASSQPRKASTQAREAYFLDHAEAIRDSFTKPILVTGGFRGRAGLNAALSGAADLTGMARALVVEPDLPRRLLDGTATRAVEVEDRFPDPMPAGGATAWYGTQLLRIGAGGDPESALAMDAALHDYAAHDAALVVPYRASVRER